MVTGKRVTIADIARIAGVSPGAVSFALNDRPGVSKETKERILAIAKEHDWRPSQAARALGGSRLGVIGLVIERPARSVGTEAFFTDLISGIQSGLRGSDASMQMRVVGDIDEEIATYRAWNGSRQVDGVVVIDPRDDDPRLAVLSELGLPAVVIGSSPAPADGHSTVWLDDEQAAHTLFDYLAAIGHRRVAYVTGPAEYQHTRLRAATLEGLAARGVEAQTLVTDFSPRAAAAAMRGVLSSVARPTAVVFDNEVMTLAGMRVAQEMGLRVPRDVSIASFDDSVIAELMHPSITSLTRDTFDLGERAARQLLDQLESTQPLPSVPGPPPTLSVRESTAPPATPGP